MSWNRIDFVRVAALVAALTLAVEPAGAQVAGLEPSSSIAREGSEAALADLRLPDRAAVLAAPSFRLLVPHRTQKDGGPWQISNCGPATLGMVLDGFGLAGQATDDLRFRSHSYQGTVGMRTGTALQHIAQVAEDFGVQTHGLYTAAGSYRAWTLEEIRAQLRLGRPVMPLVRLYLVPGYEHLAGRWGHYILLTGVTEDGFFYSDSLKPDATEGTGRRISAERLGEAMGGSHIPGQAVAFGSSVPLRVLAPGG